MQRSESKKSFFKEIHQNRAYYLMILPAAAILFLLCYLPFSGLVMAFKNYNFMDGIFGSPWAEPWYKNFGFYFKSTYFFQTTFNTLWINFNYLVWTTLVNVTFAIMLNELKSVKAKRVYQNIMFLPFFLSAIVVAQFLRTILFSPEQGIANRLLISLNLSPVSWYQTSEPWVKILVGTRIWKGTGYGIIIYLSTIAGIDESLFEAAALDGAKNRQKIWHITLPMLLPTIFTMTLLAVGRMFFGDFETIYAIQTGGMSNTISGALLKSTDIIETYIFRSVRDKMEFGTSTAVGLYQSITGFLVVYGTNALVRRYQKDYALF